MRTFALLPLLLLTACQALEVPLGPEPPISTDRPGFLFNPTLVAPGVVQVEAGVPAVAYDQSGGSHAFASAWNALVRFGVVNWLELRATTPPYIATDVSGGGGTSGWGDMELGTKLHLLEGDGGWVPVSALIASVRVPTGEDPFTSHQPGYSLNLATGWTVAEGTSLTGLLGWTRVPVSGSDDDFDNASVAAMITRALDARWSVSGQTAWYPSIDDGPDPAYVGAFVTYLVSSNVQLDLEVDAGLNDDASDWLGSFGVSFRF